MSDKQEGCQMMCVTQSRDTIHEWEKDQEITREEFSVHDDERLTFK